VLRTIRADEVLAKALGKDTYRFKLRLFMLGSLLAALAGVFFAHLQQFVGPKTFDPITTFYVWVAVILGGSGSIRGALFGVFVIIAVREGPRSCWSGWWAFLSPSDERFRRSEAVAWPGGLRTEWPPW
jgi:branched-chain amino acid transport system permease protein